MDLYSDLEEATDVELTATSLTLHPDVTPARWEEIGYRLAAAHATAKWWIADWLGWDDGWEVPGTDYDYTARRIERYRQAVAITGLTKGTLQNMRSLANRVPPECRNPRLTFYHHQEVAALPLDQQVEWLAMAETNRWTKVQLRQALRGGPVREYVGASRVERIVEAARAVCYAARSRRRGNEAVVPSVRIAELAKALNLPVAG